jgi:hypothetical protein
MWFWVEETRQKVEVAVEQLHRKERIDGEVVVERLVDILQISPTWDAVIVLPVLFLKSQSRKSASS